MVKYKMKPIFSGAALMRFQSIGGSDMVYVFLAEGFEEIEALTPVDLLRRAQVETSLVSIYPDKKTVKGARGITVECDMTISEAKRDNADLLVLPGGMPGTVNLLECADLMSWVSEHNKKGGRIAAICAAPARILGEGGYLKGKRATCYPGMESLMEGADASSDSVVTDGNITTSRGLGTAVDFACEMIKLICGSDKAAEIRASVVA